MFSFRRNPGTLGCWRTLTGYTSYILKTSTTEMALYKRVQKEPCTKRVGSQF